jgi:restriction endonuclease Mrr
MPPADFQTLMLPFLEHLKAGEERSMNDIHAALTRFVELTDDALKSFAPEQDAPAFQQAIAQARQHLTKAALIENTRADGVKITALGKLVLSKRLNSIDVEYLRRLPGYNS